MPGFGRPRRLVIAAGLVLAVACGTSGSGGEPLASCPASQPFQTTACNGSFVCQFNAGCTCTGCCSATWSCISGTFKQTG